MEKIREAYRYVDETFWDALERSHSNAYNPFCCYGEEKLWQESITLKNRERML